MKDSRTLVEHFFRHEYGRLVAVLTRSLGIRNLPLVEDVVQTALFKALQGWGQNGVPDLPGAWLHRTARNLAIDALRRIQTERRLLTSECLESPTSNDSLHETLQSYEEVGDEPLRFFFLCCHPSISTESSIALTLKSVCGFSTEEVASALLISTSNAEKRITRAKEKLRDIGTELADLDAASIESRMEAVQLAIYLLFNEGYASSSGDKTLRKELCDEAIRLARMLVELVSHFASSNCALLALMLMHSARFETRVSRDGAIVLLEDQDRSRWDWSLIRESMQWMAKSASGNRLSRYHVEAAIAWEHCRATSFQEVDWNAIIDRYRILAEMQPSPMVQLNLAIAISYAASAKDGLSLLTQISAKDRARLRPWWDCAIAEIYHRLGRTQDAISHWQDAIVLASNVGQRNLIGRRILEAQKKTTLSENSKSVDEKFGSLNSNLSDQTT